jgi:hypothetical protein
LFKKKGHGAELPDKATEPSGSKVRVRAQSSEPYLGIRFTEFNKHLSLITKINNSLTGENIATLV